MSRLLAVIFGVWFIGPVPAGPIGPGIDVGVVSSMHPDTITSPIIKIKKGSGFLIIITSVNSISDMQAPHRLI